MPTGRCSSANKDEDPVGSFLSDRLRIIEATIRQILAEIEDREKLRDQMLLEIDWQMCDIKNRLNRIVPYEDAPITLGGDTKRRSALEKDLVALEIDKRREIVAAWGDIATLRKELRESFREYQEEKRKLKLVQS